MTIEIPQTMTAVEIRHAGGPEELIAGSRPVPAPGNGEILVKVAAAGINRPDVMQRQGLYPAPPGAPDIPGLEIAGTVAALGQYTARWSVGDRVTALVPGGGYAEFCAAHGSNALPIPDELDFAEAAALPETFFTVWSNVFDRGGLQPGETFLVHGGSSGIGTTAIQLAKAFDATVIATAGSDAKCDACRELGADLAINYQTTDFVATVKNFTAGKGAHLILDMVGGDYIERNYSAAAVEGRIVQIAFLHGAFAEVDMSRLMLKRLTHTGSTLRARSVDFKARIAAALEEKVWPLLASGAVRPVMDSRFALADAAKAHARMEASSHIGKIVLTLGPDPNAVSGN